MKYNMQLGVDLRCTECRDRLSTDNYRAACVCENLKIQRTQDPVTKEVCALVETVDAGTVEAQRRDGEWVPFLEAIHASRPHIGKETEALMRRAIDYWELTRVTHKSKVDLMPPLLYWQQYGTIILGFPRISGSTTTAIKLAAERGVFAYVAARYEVMERLQNQHNDTYAKGVFTCPATMNEDLLGLEPMTFVFDGVITPKEEWDRMLNLCLECASAMDHSEVLILRVGESL